MLYITYILSKGPVLAGKWTYILFLIERIQKIGGKFEFFLLKTVRSFSRQHETFKNMPVLQEGGSTPAPPAPPIIRVVLLHKEQIV